MFSTIFTRKEFYVFLGIGLLLMFGPKLVNYSQRVERLARAILDGKEDLAREMLIAHPDLLNKADEDNGFTPLHWAVIADRTNLVYWLLEKGAAVDPADPAGTTPLHKAAVFNRLACAEMLVAHGARVSALARKYGALRLAPIHLAAEEGNADLVGFLLAHGADVDMVTEGKNRITPLHMAAAKGKVSVIKVLVAAGADINAADAAGKTPLAWAIEAEQPQAAQVLREAGAVP